jgi:Spy/CpxP family protein refolding chaperone
MRSILSASLLSAAALLSAGCVGLPGSPYAGEERRAIKALSAEEEAGLAAGEGMGFAKAAELNGYPGPAHVLQLASRLDLTAPQRAAVEEIMRGHRAEAQALGREVITLEKALDAAFAAHAASAQGTEDLVARIEAKRAALRASHLKAHIATTAILTPAQVSAYVALRGYAGHHGH